MASASLVGGAALGPAFEKVFSILYETVKDVITTTCMFESILERLKSTIDVLEPLVNEIRRSNRELDRPEEVIKGLIEKMEEGEKLVRDYSKLPWWKYLMRYRYAKKLSKLEDALCLFFGLELPVLNTRNVLETLKGVNDIRARMNLVGLNGGLLCAIPAPPDFPVGLDFPLKELKLQLLKDEVSMLVLTAPGGCGKTTLVKMLCHDKQIKGIFKDNNIFFVPVSNTPNLKVIVQKLFRHKVDQVPEFFSDEDAINQLEHLLNQIGQNHSTFLPTPAPQNNPILLILDDVWSGSESLLEKFAFRIPNYKILVTSRTSFPRFSFTYKLKPLNDEDAMVLFRHSATPQDGSSYIPGGDTVKMILKFCGGFPLALKVIGSSLCGKPEGVWRSRVMEWSNSDHSFLSSSTSSDLLVCLQRSLDFKDDEIIIKKCFLDLGSFPEDQRIPVAVLIDMWSELHELDEDGIHAIANLHEIAIRNLANLVVTRKNVSAVDNCEDFVLQHDLLRELAIHQSSLEPIEQRKRLIMDISGNNLPKWWTEQRQQPINAQLLSISTDDVFSSSWCNIQPPKVEVLVLNFQTKNYMLPEFVDKMNILKVLVVTNYGFFPAELGNFQILKSVPSLKKIRLEKISIPSLCKAPVRFTSLKKISLFMCNIGQAFRNYTIQVSDIFPKLLEINIDYCKDLVEVPTGLCDIVCLKKLSITNCHKLSALPQGIGKLRNLELLRLRSCTDLWELPESIRSLHELSILDISDCISITKLPKHIGALRNLKELHMEGCLRLRSQLPPSILDLEQLKLVICDEERVKLWESIKELHPNLEIKVAEKDINLNWLSNHF
ncbi:probable disease resistance protein At5g66900 [Corylus avellana]|uniref:probable disease resistance protein At5g66900 n=1 Tax=Corylus avellana TaxID=13451 RepID=UPI00286C484E|nr:probable disease resistance protein At5g66900 [Corylus avellana]